MAIIAEAETTATAVETWCSEVRRLHETHALPITDPNDPRVAEFIRACSKDESSPEYARSSFLRDVEENPETAGHRYFEKCIQLPTPPIAGPSWATSWETSVFWPEIHVDFESEEIRVGEITAWANHMVAIQVTSNRESELAWFEFRPVFLSTCR
ncbi:hypothetical protein Leucomu_05875 [Leucobacter muris]|uniref:Uncharacterized protein n=1 Tax=Leucobacter muris TaxID=1935379 RepID=A0ABX5QEM3_9MICO|nr:hypothetical protein [Leucobacter muris]QAB17512.1 hypothetical protein Leucomu_05875 [Leucobacter muris]